jgi:hypothetical protein
MCEPGTYLGNESTTQFSCPDKSKYYRELEVYQEASGIENKLTEQDNQLGEIRSNAYQIQEISKGLGGKENIIEVSTLNKEFEKDAALADAEKLYNHANENVNMLKLAQLEKQALNKVLSSNFVKAKDLITQKNKNIEKVLEEKKRIIEINEDSYFQKKNLIEKLSYLIYFILLAIALGLATAAGIISFRNLGYFLLFSLLVVTYFIFEKGNVLQKYGDFSDSTVKSVTRDFIKILPEKKCPKRCVKKKKDT